MNDLTGTGAGGPDRRDPLARWNAAGAGLRQVVCIGDSITYGTSDTFLRSVAWVELVARAFDRPNAARAGDGFRGLWRDDEWTRTGVWTPVLPSDTFDVAPFGQGLYSSGSEIDTLTWTKPAAMTVNAFDLYWFHMPRTGNWEYRVDDGPWATAVSPGASMADNRLHRLVVREPVGTGVQIRGYDGTAPCVAPIVGISPYARPTPTTGTVIHSVARPSETLERFCRSSGGDPFALLDEIRPHLVTVLFSNDVSRASPETFGEQLRRLVERVRPYADVLLINSYEQRPQRQVDDAMTTRGSKRVESTTASFGPADRGCRAAGTNIPAGTSVASIVSESVVELSAAATATSARGELTIGLPRDASTQAEYRNVTRDVAATMHCALLDLYDEWREMTGGGWESAYEFGLMADGLHPLPRAHEDIAARVLRVLG